MANSPNINANNEHEEAFRAIVARYEAAAQREEITIVDEQVRSGPSRTEVMTTYSDGAVIKYLVPGDRDPHGMRNRVPFSIELPDVVTEPPFAAQEAAAPSRQLPSINETMSIVCAGIADRVRQTAAETGRALASMQIRTATAKPLTVTLERDRIVTAAHIPVHPAPPTADEMRELQAAMVFALSHSRVRLIGDDGLAPWHVRQLPDGDARDADGSGITIPVFTMGKEARRVLQALQGAITAVHRAQAMDADRKAIEDKQRSASVVMRPVRRKMQFGDQK